MQNFNDLNKLQQMQKMQTVEQVQNQGGAVPPAPSKFNKFATVVWVIVLMSILVYLGYTIMRDNTKTKKQIDKNLEISLNSPEMQEYRAKTARRQREVAKQRRLRQLGIEGVTEPVEKDDLLNKQLKKQKIAEREEQIERQKPEGVDYTSELAAYNARLKEVQAEEARLRAEAEAVAKKRAEQLREQQRIITAENAEAKAQAAKEKAEQERIAKAKAAQEKAARLKAQVEALKTERKTLQTNP